MVVFWLLAVLMTAIALAFVVVPLLRGRSVAGPGALAANLAVLRGQRHEIEADVANGALPESERDAAMNELVERARDDLASQEPPPLPRASRPWIAVAAVAVAVPAIAFGLYAWLGTPGALAPPERTHEAGKLDDLQIEAMVENLARKVRERPDDARGWALLARSMAALGRYDESAQAYEHLSQLVPGDASVLADYADALGMAQGRSLAGKPYELAKKALEIDPHHRKALALAGTAAMDAGDYKGALGYWQGLAATTDPGSQDEQDVIALLDELRQKAAAAGKPLPGTAPIARAAPPANTGKALTGSVSIAASVAGKMNPSDTLFVFARAENGPRMPLAVVRTTAASLPMKFSLDDSMAMAPTARLSGASAVRIEARVSRSGNALPQSGDLLGMSAVVKPDAHDVNIVIDKVVP
ncbi:MAG TPA: c-type cytochrome biogenesis protein CcmI [Usitatibacter sp.]|nr:c-type cytochrome biogenesis protein CcmI [Usitatibacter sp.]